MENGVIDKPLNHSLKAMVGFLNIAVHDYQSIQIEIVQTIIENHIDDFVSFITKVRDFNLDTRRK